MKKDKVRLVSGLIDFNDKYIFDLGCSNGTVSYFLKKNGGTWIHADLDHPNLKTAKNLLGNNIFQICEGRLPLENNKFDLVMALDILEHMQDDTAMLAEISRILKPGGRVVVSTPIAGRFMLLNKIKSMAGLKPEIYGHVRQGYSLKQLAAMLESAGFKITHASTYAKFLVEFFEMSLNILYTRHRKVKKSDLHSGAISPSKSEDLDRDKGLYKIYTRLVYPLIYLVTRLDRLLWFKTGYATLLVADKPAE